MKRYIYLLLTVCVISACTESFDGRAYEDIVLSAKVDAGIVSRNIVSKIYKGESVANMEATVWFSTEKGIYPKNDSPVPPTYLPYRANVKYAESGPTTIPIGNTENVLAYPVDDDPDTPEGVYCVGFYPQSGWDTEKLGDGTTDDKVAIHDINGSEDLMFAEQQYGTWENPFEVQTYYHLLTWVTIVARATAPDAIDSWGNIESLSIVSPHSKVRITLDKTIAGSAVEYIEGEADIPVINTSTPLSVLATPLGDVLCAPAISYQLEITTSNGGKKGLSIPLEDENGIALSNENYAIGKQFIINLYFNSFNEINAMCSLIPWNEENIDLNGQ